MVQFACYDVDILHAFVDWYVYRFEYWFKAFHN